MEVLIFVLMIIWTFGVAKYFVDTLNYRYNISIWVKKDNWFTRWLIKPSGRWMPLNGKHFFMAMMLWPSIWLNMYLLGILNWPTVIVTWIVAYQLFLWPFHYFGVQKDSPFREDPVSSWLVWMKWKSGRIWSDVKLKWKNIFF